MYKRIKELRKSHKYTQEYVGKVIGTSGSNYSRYESGELIFNIEHLKKLTELYGVTLSYLLEDETKDIVLSKEQLNTLIKAKDVIIDLERMNNKHDK